MPHRSVFLLILLLGSTLGIPLCAGERTITFEQILEGEVRFGTSLERARFDASGWAIRVGEGEWKTIGEHLLGTGDAAGLSSGVEPKRRGSQ